MANSHYSRHREDRGFEFLRQWPGAADLHAIREMELTWMRD
jgi:hypothetical protein